MSHLTGDENDGLTEQYPLGRLVHHQFPTDVRHHGRPLADAALRSGVTLQQHIARLFGA